LFDFLLRGYHSTWNTTKNKKKIKLRDPARDKCRGLYVSGKSLVDGLSLKFFVLFFYVNILMIKKPLSGWCESVAPAPELGAYYSKAWAIRTRFLLVLEYNSFGSNHLAAHMMKGVCYIGCNMLSSLELHEAVRLHSHAQNFKGSMLDK
jgi:hypothetical protein